MTEELTANDVRVEGDQFQILGVVPFAERRRATLAIVHPWWRVAHDVHLQQSCRTFVMKQNGMLECGM